MNCTAQSLKEHIEAHFNVGQPTATGLSVTGEPYVTIGSQDPADGMPSVLGTVDEGKRREWGFDEETAWFDAVSNFQSYAEDRGHNLYWRCQPTLDRHGSDCAFYMRLLVSDK